MNELTYTFNLISAQESFPTFRSMLLLCLLSKKETVPQLVTTDTSIPNFSKISGLVCGSRDVKKTT